MEDLETSVSHMQAEPKSRESKQYFCCERRKKQGTNNAWW